MMSIASVSAISRSARLMSWLQCPLYAALTMSDCLVVFQFFLGHFYKCLGTSFGDIDQAEMCVCSRVYSLQRRLRVGWLVTYTVLVEGNNICDPWHEVTSGIVERFHLYFPSLITPFPHPDVSVYSRLQSPRSFWSSADQIVDSGDENGFRLEPTFTWIPYQGRLPSGV